MNRIDELRAQIESAFDGAQAIPDSHESLKSPCGKYRLDLVTCRANDSLNWSITHAVIRESETGNVVAQLKRNDSSFFHCWFEQGGVQYLLCAEDLEGQTCIDLTNQKIESYSGEDRFIWAEFYPSPSKGKIAIVGCYWACPYVVAIYDLSEPMRLPLKLIKEIALPTANAQFGQWLNEHALRFVCEDGQMEVHELA